MTRAQWLIEEEERLIRVRDEIDSILGVHAAHCEECGPRYAFACGTTINLRSALRHSLASAIQLNQNRQDAAEPMPVYSPEARP